MSGTVLAVCVSTDDVEVATVGASAIDKRPTPGRVPVTELGLVTDHVCDTTHHGGVDQAVYAYDDAEAQRWARELGRDLPYGWFGENLRVAGHSVTDAVVGERWSVGADGLLLEVTIPRTPCRTFAVWAAEENWIKRFHQRADVGTYLRVVQPGTVGAGDPITVISRPDHGVTVRQLHVGAATPGDLAGLLAGPDLPVKVERDARKVFRRHPTRPGHDPLER
ncbi:MAG: MOSC domain-containing protein [Gordonia sp. (in: high G+C Gram-positive bacteria)]